MKSISSLLATLSFSLSVCPYFLQSEIFSIFLIDFVVSQNFLRKGWTFYYLILFRIIKRILEFEKWKFLSLNFLWLFIAEASHFVKWISISLCIQSKLLEFCFKSKVLLSIYRTDPIRREQNEILHGVNDRTIHWLLKYM